MADRRLSTASRAMEAEMQRARHEDAAIRDKAIRKLQAIQQDINALRDDVHTGAMDEALHATSNGIDDSISDLRGTEIE